MKYATLLVPPLLVAALVLTLFACCCPGRPALAPESAVSTAPDPRLALPAPPQVLNDVPTQAEMTDVDFHVDPSAVLRIHHLRGTMQDKQKGRPLDFDDKRSFVVHIANAAIGVDGATLTALMNRYVFNYAGSPLSSLSIRLQDGKLLQGGVMHKVIDIPFEMTAEVSATADGWIRIHPSSIRICSLNGSGLMKAFGITLQRVLTNLPKGVRVEKNDTLIDPLAILPPPSIEGRLVRAAVAGGELLQTFDDGTHPPRISDCRSCMMYRGGTLRMGKLFMVDADMQVADLDPSDPFDFFIDHYNEQLVAGSTHNTPDYGLVVHMRDWAKLPAN